MLAGAIQSDVYIPGGDGNEWYIEVRGLLNCFDDCWSEGETRENKKANFLNPVAIEFLSPGSKSHY